MSCGGGDQSNTPPTFTGLPLTATQQAEAVSQIKETNRKAPAYGISDPKLPGYYVIEVRAPRPDICEDPTAMAEYVADLFYDQTPSDKDPTPGLVLLCYAGRFAAPNKIIVTAEAIPNRVVRFESEHLAAYHGNNALYEATAHHPPDKPHPIFKD